MTMKILVTGGCGFIGSNFIIKQIMQKNNTIINIDKKTYAAGPENLKNIEKHSDNYFFVEGDICNTKLVNNMFKKFQPEFNCAFCS